MAITTVRYQSKPDRADENAAFIERVFAELNAERPDGIRYITLRLDDGVSFIHIASVETEDGVNPLTRSAAFAEFQAGIGDRLEAPPVVMPATVVGSYAVSLEADGGGPSVRFYESRATIEAPAAAVWAVLKDGAAYPQWDSGVERVEGTIATGAKIKVFSAVSPGRAFPVRVQIDEARGAMTWTGGMPLGLFRGVRTFTLTTVDERTEFTMREEYTGPLLGPIWKSMPDLGPSFEQFAAGLKARVEHPVANG